MSEQKEQKRDEYWLALGMIEPEWVFMSHFLEKEEEQEEEIIVIPGATSTEQKILIRLRARVD